jgi:flotillin
MAADNRHGNLKGTKLSSALYIPMIGVAVFIIVAVLVFKSMWRVAQPNEALIISGLRERGTATDTAGDSMGFRIVTGKGKLVIPGVQVVRRLSLDLHQADLFVECVTHQGIPVQVKGTVIYKIGDDNQSITNAARRFLDQQDQMDQRVHNVFAGHLRSIVGSMTVENMIQDRELLTSKTRESSGDEMSKLGLIIDSLQIQEIDDPTGYIENLAKPHNAAVASNARIAAAEADRLATEAEQTANALMGQSRRDTAIKMAGFQAEQDAATSQAKQAGPLAEATARQAVVDQETEAARREAARQEQILLATVVRPAEAQRDADVASAQAESRVAVLKAEGEARRVELEAEAAAKRVELAAGAEAKRVELAAGASAKSVELEAGASARRIELVANAEASSTRVHGEAEADAKQRVGEAEGVAIKARGLAEADAIDARAKALATNPEAVAMQSLAERWPEVVKAAASAFDHIDNFTVLNGAEGVNEAMMKVVGSSMASFQFVRGLFVPKEALSAAPSKTEGDVP